MKTFKRWTSVVFLLATFISIASLYYRTLINLADLNDIVIVLILMLISLIINNNKYK